MVFLEWGAATKGVASREPGEQAAARDVAGRELREAGRCLKVVDAVLYRFEKLGRGIYGRKGN